ncbi:MAG: hypothetical protein IKE22_01270, partial [Atopobiaceae bacterium]|nr:hypothetical protein [Atopobiaceae bacterium]
AQRGVTIMVARQKGASNTRESYRLPNKYRNEGAVSKAPEQMARNHRIGCGCGPSFVRKGRNKPYTASA